MTGKWAKLNIYFIVTSFIILWCQSAYIAFTTAGSYAVTVSDSIVVSASSILISTPDDKMDRVGIIGWCIIIFAVASVIAAAIMCYRLRLKGQRDSSPKKRMNIATVNVHAVAHSSGFSRSPQMYQKYGRNIEVRRH